MSKSPDLSAFPIPRKGGARPIGLEEGVPAETAPDARAGSGAGEGARAPEAPKPPPRPARTVHPPPAPLPPPSGQVVATTVKLDESRYLRLVNAGQPGPGRLKRRTIQEMMVEAIDEWFVRRGL